VFGAFVRKRSLLRNSHIMNTKSWSGAEIGQLIEIYRNQRCLWDSSDADYLQYLVNSVYVTITSL